MSLYLQKFCRAALAGWLFLALPMPVLAQSESNAFDWLQKIHAATQKLSYTGTFVYQHGAFVETSRITRYVDAGGAREKLEALEGGVREIIRSPHQVAYYSPGTMTVKIDREVVPYSFPMVLPSRIRDLKESYIVTTGESDRVAGYDCQVVILEPRDGLRYGRKLWADIGTGMLLKTRVFNEQHDPVETFSFTQLQIGHVDPDKVRSSFSSKTQNWRVEDSGLQVARLGDTGWSVRAVPPGFRKIGELRRKLGNATDVGQFVYSDGLAAISVFIEPLDGHPPKAAGLVRRGAVNVFTRRVGDHWITVVGETPVESVRLVADAVEYRKP